MASGQNKVLATQEHITFGIWIIKETPSMFNFMKYKFLLALLLTSFVKSHAGDLTTVTIASNLTQGIIVPEGKVLEIVSFQGSGAASYVPNATSFANASSGGFGLQVTYMVGTQRFAGPGVFINNGLSGVGVTYRLVDNVSTTTTTPTSAVVIPTDATGPVNVILESSTDLVTWTAANPGTYGASTTKRFFRVRAVNQSTPDLPSL